MKRLKTIEKSGNTETNLSEKVFSDAKKSVGSSFYQAICRLIVHQYNTGIISDLKKKIEELEKKLYETERAKEKLVKTLNASVSSKIVEDLLSNLGKGYVFEQCNGFICSRQAIIFDDSECVASDTAYDFKQCSDCKTWFCEGCLEACCCEKNSYCYGCRSSHECDDCTAKICFFCSEECPECSNRYCETYTWNVCKKSKETVCLNCFENDSIH